MGKTFFKNGRSTPYILTTALLAIPAFAEPRGHWQFTEDGTGIELRSCSPGEATLCAAFTQFPKSAKALSPAQRRAVCGIAILGDLQPAKAKSGELARLDGWVDDIESMTPEGKAPRYAATLVVLSENRARLDVRGTFGIVIDQSQLVRALAPISDCR
jgi:hypothetical protein